MDERITKLLRGSRHGLTFREIFTGLELPAKKRGALQKSLRELAAKGTVWKVRNRFFWPSGAKVVRGRFSAAFGGFGFVTPEDSAGRDIFIPARATSGARQGDLVQVLVADKGKTDKPEGRVTRVVKRFQERILGVYLEREGRPSLLPLDSLGGQEIPLRPVAAFSPAPGMIVAAGRDSAQVEEVFGFPDDPGVDTRVVIRKFGLSTAFSAEALAEAEGLSAEMTSEERAARTDFLDWPTVTIDGEDAQDFDDAVSIRRLAEDRYLLGVHIADVSFYIRPDSALDREAFERATSAYFPGLTLPMLPERLSNGLCSLRPREEKRTFSALLEMNAQGEVLAAEFKPSLIRTVERLTYTSVFKIFNDDPDELRRYREIVPELRAMRELARSIRRRRREEGSLDFDLPEPELIYEEGRLQSVALTGQNEAHKLIEDFMIAANEAVASFLERQQAASIYRVHPPPDSADLEKLREILLALGLFLPKPPKVTSRDLQKVLEDAAGRTEEKLVSRELLRAMRLAVYAEENQGHFGLARRTYTHFTSPIRRYPDLVVHRRLKDILSGSKTKPQGLASTALHCSTRERNADAAEKDLLEWRIFRLLHSKLGEELRGTVVEINKAGLLLALDDYFVEGLLAFTDLGGDYFRLKSPGTVMGRRTGRLFRLGDRLSVTLAAVNPIERRMNLVLSRAKSKERR